MNLKQINTVKSGFVQENAQFNSEKLKWKKIKKISKLEQQEPVFNLEVKGMHNFAVNGGLVVHNCMDALRYSLSPFKELSRKIHPHNLLLLRQR